MIVVPFLLISERKSHISLRSSISTPAVGLRAQVIEVKDFEELESIGEKKVKGKFVFYNRAMPADLIDTFEAYKETVDQRSIGAKKAARLGAVGVIVRSINLRLDDYPCLLYTSPSPRDS